MGLEGFTGNESILYHLQSPCRVKELGEFEPIEHEEWVPERMRTVISRRTAPSRPVTRSPDAAC